jgi:hypothetical protein
VRNIQIGMEAVEWAEVYVETSAESAVEDDTTVVVWDFRCCEYFSFLPFPDFPGKKRGLTTLFI